MNILPDATDSIHFEVGNAQTTADMHTLSALRIFDDRVLLFFSALSKELVVSAAGFSDVATFAFWCRKAAMEARKKEYLSDGIRIGKGVAFHSTPSNVPVNFAFSFAAGLLSGNANIVRLPAKEFPQTSIICSAIKKILHQEEFSFLVPYIVMLRYRSSQALHDYFSSISDIRIVWGGDETVQKMRASPLDPRAMELTFPNRFSLAVINADSYLKKREFKMIAKAFYNDTYFTDQNACTSARFVIWLGEKKNAAKEIFWDALVDITGGEYTLTPVQSVGKLEAFCNLAAQTKVTLRPAADMTVMRVQVLSLEKKLVDFVYHSGFFMEYDANNLVEILPLCTKACQTLTYYGISQEEFRDFILNERPSGIDRIVPIGQSMEFTLFWDGYDLIRSLSRLIAL